MNYLKKTVFELKTTCKELQIRGVSKMKKNLLIKLLREYDLKQSLYKSQELEHIIIFNQKKVTVNKEDAEKSATEWIGSDDSIFRTWLVNAIMDQNQHKDIGKVLAYVTEVHVNKWLTKKTGLGVMRVDGKSYDSKIDNGKTPIRFQIKFRMDKWHLETTRRNSIKNKETNSTGHIAYKKDEFDMLIIFKPGPTFGITGSIIRIIPAHVLVNPKKPDQLITTIYTHIRNVYDCDEKTEEIIKSLSQKHLSLLG